MKRPLTGGLVALAFATCSAGAQTFPTSVDSCRQGACIRTEFLGRTEEARTAAGVLYRVEYRAGRISGARASFRAPEQAFAYCSINRPAYIFRTAGETKWTAHLLAPGYEEAIAGYNTLTHRFYNIICHGVNEAEGPMARAVRNAQGYPARLVREARQIELMDPREILEIR